MIVRAVVGHAAMLAVMAFAMIGGHSVTRAAAAVVVFIIWAGVVAVRVRFGRGHAAVHTVVDLLAMAAVTAVPMLVSSGGAHHGGGVYAGGVAAAGGVAGAFGTGQTVTATVVAAAVVAAWAMLARLTSVREGERGTGSGADAGTDAVAIVGSVVTGASLIVMVVMIAVGWH